MILGPNCIPVSRVLEVSRLIRVRDIEVIIFMVTFIMASVLVYMIH